MKKVMMILAVVMIGLTGCKKDSNYKQCRDIDNKKSKYIINLNSIDKQIEIKKNNGEDFSDLIIKRKLYFDLFTKSNDDLINLGCYKFDSLGNVIYSYKD